MRRSLILAATLAFTTALPAAAQDADDVRFFGIEGPNTTLASMVVVDNTVYLSGVLGTRAGPGIDEQTHQVMQTIRDNLAEVGATMDDVVKCLIFMADLSERPRFNEIYRSYFPTNRPARSAVGVDLGGPRVEVECIAVIPEN